MFRSSICCLLACGLLVSQIKAQDVSPQKGPRMVEVQALFLRAAPADISAALKEGNVSDGVFGPDELAKILFSLKKGGAVIFGNPRALTVSGQRASVDAIREFRFPTEYENKEKTIGKSVPISFDSVQLGVRFSFELKSVQESRITLIVNPEVSTFIGFIDFTGSSESGEARSLEALLNAPLREGGVWQPVFGSFKASAEVSVISGQTVIIGGTAEEISLPLASGRVAKDMRGDGRFIYVFVTTRLIPEK